MQNPSAKCQQLSYQMKKIVKPSPPSSSCLPMYRLFVVLFSLGLFAFCTGFVAEHPRFHIASRKSSSPRGRRYQSQLRVGTTVYTCPKDELESARVLQDGRIGRVNRRLAMLAMVCHCAGGTVSMTMSPSVANAVYGSDAKMTFPDPIQSMSDRAGKQCLVESLGTRECLVYREDEEKLLYKGADVNSLLVRVQEAARALDQDIPPLVESKKWTQLSGVLTGPMGQLSSTMALLQKLAENPGLAKQNAQRVKQDVFAIGTAVTNKQADAVLKYRSLALEDLATFLKDL